LANPEHLAKLQEGVEVWNERREQSPDVEPGLSVADLSEPITVADHIKLNKLELRFQ
jgi:hypothetical protein